ncbi:helix-turn-helix transcriptional regulator [Fulvimonas sp. R45]|uniref:helix-turn-helix domain-containing protein n=1 Tax=Fulvimonas sp. R45 TaxID=3045937 RepID=UPI00265FBED0|nr:helix-turn-helix transcriptional regulator [Fulvimonas sp. R45]MDO1530166.1 helix-turn-helix transcriptional regulator [Fulvimonas sp. R45]
MKTEQSAFAERLAAALEAAGIEASPTVLEKLVPKYGGENVTPQAISSWLSGKHLPKQANMQALARIVGMLPHELRFGAPSRKGVREPNVAWPDHVRGHDRLAIEDFLALPDAQRKLVRELIASLAATTARKPSD